jgi:hypothetical protein
MSSRQLSDGSYNPFPSDCGVDAHNNSGYALHVVAARILVTREATDTEHHEKVRILVLGSPEASSSTY